MVNRYLMTHSLLRSWLYAMKDDPNADATTERDHVEEFMKVLRREPTSPSNAMTKGNDFEDLVTAVLYGAPSAVYHRETKEKELIEVHMATAEHPWYEAAANVAARIKGGVLQVKANRVLIVEGTPILLHGRLDALKAGEIFDIKYSSGGYDVGKFFDSTQHPAYFELIPEAQSFTYLVSNGSAVWTETYQREETRSIVPIISDFLAWLRDTGRFDVFQQFWKAK